MKKSLISLFALGIICVSANAQSANKQSNPMVNAAKYEATKTLQLSERQRVESRSAIVPVKVLNSKTLKNGAKIEYAKCNDGNIRKRIVSPENAAQAKFSVSKSNCSLKSTSSKNFYEDFEEYDGTAWDWVPTGWSDVSKTNPPHEAPDKDLKKPNLTWAVINMGTVSNKDYCAFCQVSTLDTDSGTPEEAQDEWLITPTISVAQHEKLNFVLGYRPGWVLFNLDDWTFTAQNNILEVQISDDNGATWEKVWDCMADAKSYSEDELWNSVGTISPTYINVISDLNKYAGKDIKIAFRYVGKSGESVSIDNVTVGVPIPEASYKYPACSFFSGFNMDYISDEYKTLLLPSYTDITWENTSNEDSETFEWLYQNDDFSYGTTTTKDLTMSWSYFRWWPMPTLTAKAENAEESVYNCGDVDCFNTGGYNWMWASDDDDDDSIVILGACNYDLSKRFNSYSLNEERTAFLFGTGSNEFYKQMYKADNANLASVANYFEKPFRHYIISKVWVNAKTTADPDAEFTLNIIRVEDNGNLTNDTIATSVCKGSELIPDKFNNGYVSLPFYFKEGNDSIITIDSAILMTLSGFQSDKVTSFAAFAQDEPNDDDNYAYMFVDVEKDGKTTQKLLSASQLKLSDDRVLNTALLFNMDATYTYFITKDDETDFSAPAEGCKKIINVKSLDDYDTSTAPWNTWKVTDIEGEPLPDWISVSFSYNLEDLEFYPTSIQFTVLPNDKNTARNASVLISMPGEQQIFNVNQGASGMTVNKTDNNINVSVCNGNFIINATSSVSKVWIYNTNGQEAANAAIINGKAEIDGSQLPSGVYMLKFDNGSVVKAIK